MAKTTIEVRQSRRKQIEASLKKVLLLRNLDLAQCGIKTFVLPEWDAVNGFWREPGRVTPKAPRWIVRLDRNADGSVIAGVPVDSHGEPHSGTDRLGFANTTRGNVGALALRVVPAIAEAGGSARLHEDWEWILVFVFGHGLPTGSAAQSFEGFEPATGRLQYLNSPLTYVAANLFALNNMDEELPDLKGTPATYAEATQALQHFIHISPT